ncbi:MAG: hypothetical protein SNH16_03965 [Rikenellaceae bacterium]
MDRVFALGELYASLAHGGGAPIFGHIYELNIEPGVARSHLAGYLHRAIGGGIVDKKKLHTIALALLKEGGERALNKFFNLVDWHYN